MKKILLASVFCVLGFQPAQSADVYLGLQAFGSGGKPLGVGLASFEPASAAADTLRSVLREDLLFSGYFSIYEGGPALQSGHVDSVAWGSLGAQVLITGQVTTLADKVMLGCKILDVGTGKTLFGKEGTGSVSALRRLAHLMADQMIFQLSGQPGMSHTRIAFANNQTGHKEIYVMDYDGANVRQMSYDRNIALLPKWSPDGKQIVFNSYRAGNPDAYLLDYPGGTLHQLSMRQGLNTAPNWSPDSTHLVLTMSRQGHDPDLFLIDRTGHVIRQLTMAPGVDTSGTFSPNGQQITFVSDRAGNPELYMMDVTGGNAHRLTYGQWVDGPAWSPRGDQIVYERQRSQGRYDIYVIGPKGQSNTALTDSDGRNENPNWSPDGRHIVFTSTRNNGRRQIFMMDADGSTPHVVGDMPADSFDPSWGP